MATISKEQEKMLADEIEIMKKVDHPNCVCLVEVIDDPAHYRVYLIMEYVDGKRPADVLLASLPCLV